MYAAYQNALRLQAIFHTLARHGVLPFSNRYFPLRAISWLAGLNPKTFLLRRRTTRSQRLRMALEELGPTFIKFGQALSTRMDVLPDDIGQEMRKLQDSVPPFPFAVARKTVEGCLGGPLEHFFSRFEETPVATASIAQVHRAITREGLEVAVKIKRPHIEAMVEADIRILTAIANLIEKHIPEWRRFRARKVVDEFTETIRNEMNFRVEATHAQQFHRNFAGDPMLRVPQVLWSHSSQRVLTMEWIEGVPLAEIHQHPALKNQANAVAHNIMTVFFQQVFRDGYFHADLHPGNIFVLPSAAIAIVDFGIVGHVSLQTRIWLAEILYGMLKRDYRKVARIHMSAGYVPEGTGMEDFEEALRLIGEPIFGQPLKEISIASLLAQMFQVTERFQMAVQPQLLLLQKTMLVVEGVGRQLDPELNMWLLAEPLIRAWVKENLGPKGKMRLAKQNMEDMAHVAWALPDVLHQGMDKLAHDRIRMGLHPDTLRHLDRQLQAGLRRAVDTVSAGTLFIGGAIMVSAHLSMWWYGPPFVLAGLFFLLGRRRIR